MVQTKSLKKLLGHLHCTCLQGAAPNEIQISAIVTDSRQVTDGTLFVAVKGENFDGHDFISSAAELGSIAILIEEGSVDREAIAGLNAAVFAVKSTREALARVAASMYDNPQDEMTLVGITGTNGKTTVTYLLEKVIKDQGEKVGVIGTVSYRYYDCAGVRHESAAPLTTPDPLVLLRMLRHMADAGVGTVLMEVSSHALVQRRLGCIFFDIAAFTNLSHDHLDYHPSMEEYFQAKTQLFLEYLKPTGKAVVTFTESAEVQSNKWPSALVQLLETNDVEYLSCGHQKGSIVEPISVDIEIDQTRMTLRTANEEIPLVSPLVGRFNVDNIMTTLAISSALHFDMKKTVVSLKKATGAPGRLQRVFLTQSVSPQKVAFVDYAHTPDALLNVLKTLRALPHDRLICVFGCGGDRDISKRPEMGKIAAQLADIAIVTEDNPRTESSEQILGHILEGVRSTEKNRLQAEQLLGINQSGEGYMVIADRRKAIRCAVQASGPQDVVVIAGKGHEKYQITNQGKRFFDDTLEVQEALLSWDVDNVTRALGGDPDNRKNNLCFQGICTDTRALQRGELFIALRGESFDGHDYVKRAVKAGAGGLVIADNALFEDSSDIPIFRVADTQKALGSLAGFRRRQLALLSKPKVIGVTGSTGKTTVKEMISSIFEKQWPDCETAPLNRVLKTKGNFNNLIGLPLSLLPMELKHRVAVLEMGMNIPGEISQLAEIADPDISCIVNVHGAHLEGLGSIEGVAHEKAQLFSGTKKGGILVVNSDDPFVVEAAAYHDHKKIFYSTRNSPDKKVDLYVTDMACREDGNMSFKLHIEKKAYQVNLGVPGEHNVANSLAAAAVGFAAGVSDDILISGLESFKASDKRLQIVNSKMGYSIINDTYNANPVSMKAGLATLSAMKGEIKIAVLGDMLELGKKGAEAHFNVGQVAGEAGLAYLFIVGNFAKELAAGAADAGMAEDQIKIFTTKEEIPTRIKQLEQEGRLTGNSWIFVKASRGMRLETVVESLVEK